MNRYQIALFILFAYIVSSRTVRSQSKILTEAAPAAGGFSASRLARLDSGMSNWVNQKWVNGSVALIARHGSESG